MSLNVSKTHFITFGKHKKLQNISISIDDNTIERVRVTKFLGVLIDDMLFWVDHISYVASRIAKIVSIVYKMRLLLERKALTCLYNALVLPHYSCCCEVWPNNDKTRLTKPLTMQKKVIRIILKVDKYAHTGKLFSSLSVLKFVDIVKFKTIIVMFRDYYCQLPGNLQTLFQQCKFNNKYETCSLIKFKIVYTRTTLKANCISVLGSKLWNELPDQHI